MTSAQKGVTGSRNAAILWTNSLNFVDRDGDGSKNRKTLWKSCMEAPFCGFVNFFCHLRLESSFALGSVGLECRLAISLNEKPATESVNRFE